LDLSLLLGFSSKDITNTSAKQNKDKAKKGVLPNDMHANGRYHAARTVGDVWICYPWEATDIDEHDGLGAEQKAAGNANQQL